MRHKPSDLDPHMRNWHNYCDQFSLMGEAYRSWLRYTLPFVVARQVVPGIALAPRIATEVHIHRRRPPHKNPTHSELRRKYSLPNFSDNVLEVSGPIRPEDYPDSILLPPLRGRDYTTHLHTRVQHWLKDHRAWVHTRALDLVRNQLDAAPPNAKHALPDWMVHVLLASTPATTPLMALFDLPGDSLLWGFLERNIPFVIHAPLVHQSPLLSPRAFFHFTEKYTNVTVCDGLEDIQAMDCCAQENPDACTLDVRTREAPLTHRHRRVVEWSCRNHILMESLLREFWGMDVLDSSGHDVMEDLLFDTPT